MSDGSLLSEPPSDPSDVFSHAADRIHRWIIGCIAANKAVWSPALFWAQISALRPAIIPSTWPAAAVLPADCWRMQPFLVPWGQQDGWASGGREGAEGCPHGAPGNPSDQEGELGELNRKAANIWADCVTCAFGSLANWLSRHVIGDK